MKSDRPPAGSFEDASLQTLLNGARLTLGERLDWLESMVDLFRSWHGQAAIDRQWLAETPGASWESAGRLLRVAEGSPPYEERSTSSAPLPPSAPPPHTP